MRIGITSDLRKRRDSGQSIVEMVLMLPLLLLVLLNAVNFGYCFLTILNITAAPRSGALYAIVGPSSPKTTNYAPAGGSSTLTVSYLTQQDLTGALSNPAANATIQVCSQTNISAGKGTNGTGAGMKANCVTCTGGTCQAVNTGATNEVPDADPEAPNFVLYRVDVQYTFIPLIPGRPFNLALWPTSLCNATATSCTFHRFAEMRAM